MSAHANQVMLIGLDAPIVSRLYDLAMDGTLPVLKSVIERGVYAKHCLVPFPTITPPNWTTMVTGAWPGTHGVTDYHVHLSGDPLDKIHQGFDSHDCRSERIWDTAERIGKKSIIFDYPTYWPPTIKEGIQLGGGGVGINSWRNERPGITLCADQLYATDRYPLAAPVEMNAASGWTGLEEEDALEAELVLRYRNARFPVKRRSWYLLAQNTGEGGYDRILLCTSKDTATAFAEIGVGAWTPVIEQTFETREGARKATFRCKLLELSSDGRTIKLYVTTLNAHEGWSYPESVASEIPSAEGLPSARDGYHPLTLGWLDLDTFMEVVEFQHIWISDAVSYLLTNKAWDLFFMHAHCPDWMYHTFSRKLDPLTNPDADERAQYEQVERTLYESLDRMIGRILDCADEDTLVILSSDHGAKATTAEFQPADVLEQAGLTVYQDIPGKTQLDPGTMTRVPVKGVDWTQTKAVVQRSCYVYVNLKGRDPQGIVEPGDEYEAVQEQIIRALYDYTDPETGRKPVVLALKREDARVLGLYGDRVGDVIFALDPAFGHEHGPFLPTARYGIGGMDGLFIMAGPGVHKGHTLERTVSLTDIVPTICYLAELPLPAHAEGGILYQALENPNEKLEELQTLREHFAQLQQAYESEQAETHSYYE